MPTSEQLQRTKELRQFVTQELEDFQAGRVHSLTPYPQLNARFGYTHRSSAFEALDRAGLAERRRALVEESKFEPTPSEELAWLVGVFAAGDAPDKNGGIQLTSESTPLLNAFSRRCVSVFNLEPTRSPEGAYSYSADIYEKLGNLNKDSWHETVLEKHAWIVQKRIYAWRFLEGFFEIRGSLQESERGGNTRRSVILQCAFPNGANLLSQLMFNLGVNNPVLKKLEDGTVQAAAIENTEGVRFFANNVHSEDPTKEEKLERFRHAEIKTNTKYSVDDLVKEWRNILEILGPNPSARKIERARKQGLTKIHPQIYGDRFGNRNFSIARQLLTEAVQKTPTNVQRTLELIREMTPSELRELSAQFRTLLGI